MLTVKTDSVLDVRTSWCHSGMSKLSSTPPVYSSMKPICGERMAGLSLQLKHLFTCTPWFPRSVTCGICQLTPEAVVRLNATC